MVNDFDFEFLCIYSPFPQMCFLHSFNPKQHSSPSSPLLELGQSSYRIRQPDDTEKAPSFDREKNMLYFIHASPVQYSQVFKFLTSLQDQDE